MRIKKICLLWDESYDDFESTYENEGMGYIVGNIRMCWNKFYQAIKRLPDFLLCISSYYNIIESIFIF